MADALDPPHCGLLCGASSSASRTEPAQPGPCQSGAQACPPQTDVRGRAPPADCRTNTLRQPDRHAGVAASPLNSAHFDPEHPHEALSSLADSSHLPRGFRHLQSHQTWALSPSWTLRTGTGPRSGAGRRRAAVGPVPGTVGQAGGCAGAPGPRDRESSRAATGHLLWLDPRSGQAFAEVLVAAGRPARMRQESTLLQSQYLNWAERVHQAHGHGGARCPHRARLPRRHMITLAPGLNLS